MQPTAQMMLNPFESPSLTPKDQGRGTPYEFKFLVDLATAAALEDWGRRKLALDPHGNPEQGGAYCTVSVYCDTPQGDVLRRADEYRGWKLRGRRYGGEPVVYWERKNRRGNQVSKRRGAASIDGLAREAGCDWFREWMTAFRLAPACQIQYHRTAFGGVGLEGPLRLTIDRGLHGAMVDHWRFDPQPDARPLLSGQAVVEMKFRDAMPALFKSLLLDFRLNPVSASKYRLCRLAWPEALPADIPREQGGEACRNG